MNKQACDFTDCSTDAIWHLKADGSGHRPPNVAFACDQRGHLMSAIGTVIEDLSVCAGAIDFQVLEDGFPVSQSREKAT